MNGRIVVLLFALALPAASPASAQSLNPLERLESLHLSQARVGRVAVFFAPGDSARADELADLADHAASFLARELGVDGPLRLAVLAPDDWFSRTRSNDLTQVTPAFGTVGNPPEG